MRVLIVNKFFYPRGGDCTVAMSTRRLLMEHGHDVRVFSMSHPQNIDIPDVAGYASAIDFGGSVKEKIRGIERLFGFGDIRKSFEAVLDDFKPDVVHLHNIHSYLSPVVGELAHKRGIRVVWTLHDYKLICPSYTCRRTTGETCEDCITGSPAVSVHRCMKGSRMQSAMADAEARFWNRKRISEFTDMFIAPSRFLGNKMLEGGFPPSKLTVLNNFIEDGRMKIIRESGASAGNSPREDYFCYIGRLSEEKGVDTLLRAAAEGGVKLKLAGDGPMADELRQRYAAYPDIEFLGHLDFKSILSLLSKAQASVLPSEWYENNPLGVIESVCAGTPVIGAAIGGIPELIDSSNGVGFTSGNMEELKGILKNFSMLRKFDYENISRRASERFSGENHYSHLLKIYQG